MITQPRYFAISGYNHCGKSLLTEIIERRFGIVACDDGRPVRDACKILYGLTEEQVTTEAGKNQVVQVNGHDVQVRKLLGDMAVWLEMEHGESVLPWSAIAAAERAHPDAIAFAFGSVRRRQALGYTQNGGVAIFIDRDGCAPAYAFDEFDRSLYQHILRNPCPRGQETPEGLRAYEAAIVELFSRWCPLLDGAAPRLVQHA